MRSRHSTTNSPPRIPGGLRKARALGIDSDLDGLSDAWEMLKFGDLDKTAYGDLDLDGWTNLDEYLRNTNPTAMNRTPGTPSSKPSDVRVSENPSGGNTVIWTPTPRARWPSRRAQTESIGPPEGLRTALREPLTILPPILIHQLLSRRFPRCVVKSVSSNPLEDFDGDGLSNQEEAANGTNPSSGDSDGDGVLDGVDGWARSAGLYPTRRYPMWSTLF